MMVTTHNNNMYFQHTRDNMAEEGVEESIFQMIYTINELICSPIIKQYTRQRQRDKEKYAKDNVAKRDMYAI